mmetsp:Transcript_13720/g.28167  ORF Transcript_13720/g.28167 Transcript_13720/m.28167 type:complete len:140 (-) Transcript_13720:716-1135(-)
MRFSSSTCSGFLSAFGPTLDFPPCLARATLILVTIRSPGISYSLEQTATSTYCLTDAISSTTMILWRSLKILASHMCVTQVELEQATSSPRILGLAQFHESWWPRQVKHPYSNESEISDTIWLTLASWPILLVLRLDFS